ncbi:hypothetical protein ACVBEH_03460 [Roseateles sp. GG27B]
MPDHAGLARLCHAFTQRAQALAINLTRVDELVNTLYRRAQWPGNFGA